MIGFTTVGQTRGCCGHAHRTRASAQACLRRHITALVRAGGGNGYDDRQIIEIRDVMFYQDPDFGRCRVRVIRLLRASKLALVQDLHPEGGRDWWPLLQFTIDPTSEGASP